MFCLQFELHMLMCTELLKLAGCNKPCYRWPYQFWYKEGNQLYMFLINFAETNSWITQRWIRGSLAYFVAPYRTYISVQVQLERKLLKGRLV